MSTSAVFTGSSQFSTDFQNSIKRAVDMASLPITLMTKDVTTLQSQSDTLDTINTKFAALQTAVQGMSDAMLGSSFQAEISDPAVVSATLGDAAQEGTYSIDVQNVGAYAVSMTPSNWDGTSSAKHAYQLWVGDMSDPKNKIDITPDNDSAASVAAAINAKASDKVRATVVNVGSSSSPDYRISLQSTTLGAKPLQLVDASHSLQKQTVAGDASTKALSTTSGTWAARANPAGTQHTYQLWIGDKSDPANEIDITPDDNSAESVARAINENASASAKVTATVINSGTEDAPDYRIQLEANDVGALPLDIVDANLQNQTTTGALAQFVVNSSGKVVTSLSRQVTVSDGITVNLLSSNSGNPVSITVTRSTSALTTALTAFTTAYNAVVDELDLQRGASQGSLGGQSIVSDLKDALRGISTYNESGGPIMFGLELGTDGHLTFDQFKLFYADLSSSASVTNFFGSAAGGGFIKVAADALAKVEDSTSGLIATAKSNIATAITDTNTKISDKQAQVDALNERLLTQMSAADAAIAAMEQQYSYLYSMFSAMDTANKSYQ
jgi:flagellar hook-associated protein 2